ncbi:MAG: hypothetical protein HC837_10865 [Chloroflexaceae bacterium]|nr:hypothetical protein [Chloroflexaceae bacterium]
MPRVRLACGRADRCAAASRTYDLAPMPRRDPRVVVPTAGRSTLTPLPAAFPFQRKKCLHYSRTAFPSAPLGAAH